MGEPQGQPRRVQKISPMLGFDARPVHPQAGHYTHCTIPAYQRIWRSKEVYIGVEACTAIVVQMTVMCLV